MLAALLELCSIGTVEAHIHEPLSRSSPLANRYIWDILPIVERNMFDKSNDELNSKGLYICQRGRGTIRFSTRVCGRRWRFYLTAKISYRVVFFNWASPENVSRLAPPPKNASTGPPPALEKF